MQAPTWIDRITDESNLWLNATRSDDQQDYAQAVVFYLKDASDCLKGDMLPKAALSCSCAADCLAKMGLVDHARELYRETARLYQENAEAVAGVSVRELLWSLRESYQFFLIAGDGKNAEDIHRRYVVIARRVDPFVEEGIVQLPESKSISEVQAVPIESIPGGVEVAREVEAFMQSRRMTHQEMGRSSKPTQVAPGKNRRGTQSNEKSIVNQLG
jgi:hypothetical protein